MAPTDPLKRYRSKRNFVVTSEPEGGGAAHENKPIFVVQKHWARKLHYDFRLELAGVLKSWAIPKGPSLDPAVKRMAIHVEDHPLAYSQFEGRIPQGEYGAGEVLLWDRGTWAPDQAPHKAYAAGKLTFTLNGGKLRGRWALVRMKGDETQHKTWLLIKEKDKYARSADEVSSVEELPATFKPQLATLADSLPDAPHDWLYEIKFDGYRLLARIDGRTVQLVTRNGHDWTHRLPDLSLALRKMGLPPGWYDGEIVALNDHGLPDFQALQNAFDTAQTARIRYYLFDLPYFNGEDVRSLPLTQRRMLLEQVLEQASIDKSGLVQFSKAFDAPARDIQATACKMGLEGIIAKRKDASYVSGRSTAWLKLKCGYRQEFVIGGYTDPQGSRTGIGALLVGFHDERGALRYAGKVGTGFSNRSLQALSKQLATLQTDNNPFADDIPSRQTAHWVRPQLLAEVSFAQWTSSGRIRHAVFHGLRRDKPTTAITRDSSMPSKKPSTSTSATGSPSRKSVRQGTSQARNDNGADSALGTLKVTHPERIVDPSTSTSKLEVVRYYAEIAPLMMPHLKGRPVALVRAPEGIKGQTFFQKHLEASGITGVRTLPVRLDPGHEPLLEVATERGLAAAAQMNVLEFHTWNALKTLIERPDRMTFDLDPGKGVTWAAIQEAALLLRVLLTELALEPLIKTSGGKGLHIVVPLKRGHDWDTVKGVSRAIVQHLAKTFPKRFAAKSGPRNRVGKIYVDYLRNGRGATTVAAWSLRARPGMGISVPIHWDEVEHIPSATHWHLGNIHERIDVGNAPWVDAASATTLTQAMKILKYKRG